MATSSADSHAALPGAFAGVAADRVAKLVFSVAIVSVVWFTSTSRWRDQIVERYTLGLGGRIASTASSAAKPISSTRQSDQLHPRYEAGGSGFMNAPIGIGQLQASTIFRTRSEESGLQSRRSAETHAPSV